MRKVRDIYDAANRLTTLAEQVLNKFKSFFIINWNNFQVVSGQIKPEAYAKESEATKKKLRNLQEEVETMIQRL